MLSTYPLLQSRSKSNTSYPVEAKPTSQEACSAFSIPHQDLGTKGHLHAKFSPSELHSKSRTAHFIPLKGSTKCVFFPDGLGAGRDGNMRHGG